MKLLSRAIDSFSPAEYREFIRSLYKKWERRKPRAAVSKKKPFIAKRTKTGKLQLKVNRDPRWLSEEEMQQISEATQIPLNEIFLKMQKDGVVVSDAEAQRTAAELPW